MNRSESLVIESSTWYIIRREKPEIHGDLHCLLSLGRLHVKSSNLALALLFVLNNLPSMAMLLFGTILLLNLTNLPRYTFIWPISLFGTREYAFYMYITKPT